MSTAYEKLCMVIEVHIVCWDTCYPNYMRVTKELLDWTLSSTDRAELSKLEVTRTKALHRYSKLLAYDIQRVALHLSIPEYIVQTAFLEVIKNGLVRETRRPA